MASRLNAHKHTFQWDKMAGSQEELRWNLRDLTTLDAVLARVPGRKACVQAGACVGIFAKYLARSFAQVITFEPDPVLFVTMCQNAPEPNIIRFQAALGQAPGLVGTACCRRDTTGKPVHEGLTHVVPGGIIPTMRLDDLALPVCDLIQLDLEGFEGAALVGAAETLARCRPVLMVELNGNCEHYGLTRDEVRGWILAQGYQFVERIHSDEVFVPNEVTRRWLEDS